jgi:cytidylate kinase
LSGTDLRYEASVCISGLTAAGKTTHSHLLAGEFGLTYVSGSQIQLNFMGVSPIQARDFWITDKAKSFWDQDGFNRIDTELLRLEQLSEGYIFDTSTMPWRHRKPALCIWLESDLKSRALKSIVSHRGRSTFLPDEYKSRIVDKDNSTKTIYNSLWGIEIGNDLSCFDLILDISSLISDASLCASLRSIRIAHSVIQPAVGWYLTRHPQFLNDFQKAVELNSSLVLVNKLL